MTTRHSILETTEIHALTNEQIFIAGLLALLPATKAAVVIQTSELTDKQRAGLATVALGGIDGSVVLPIANSRAAFLLADGLLLHGLTEGVVVDIYAQDTQGKLQLVERDYYGVLEEEAAARSSRGGRIAAGEAIEDADVKLRDLLAACWPLNDQFRRHVDHVTFEGSSNQVDDFRQLLHRIDPDYSLSIKVPDRELEPAPGP